MRPYTIVKKLGINYNVLWKFLEHCLSNGLLIPILSAGKPYKYHYGRKLTFYVITDYGVKYLRVYHNLESVGFLYRSTWIENN